MFAEQVLCILWWDAVRKVRHGMSCIRERVMYEPEMEKARGMVKNITKDDFGTLAIYAVRYCQGRQTYVPELVREIIAPHLPDISDNHLSVMIDDCEFQETMNLYGDEKIDKPGWIRWKELLITEKNRRKSGDGGISNGKRT